MSVEILLPFHRFGSVARVLAAGLARPVLLWPAMNTTNHQNQIAAALTLSDDEIVACITDSRPELVELFTQLDGADAKAFAVEIWSIGSRALTNAHRLAEESRLGDVGKQVLDEVNRRLDAHVEAHQRTMLDVLRQYFDPNDGQLTVRLRAFADDSGALAQLLNRFMGPQASVLAETLAHQIGAGSDLLKRLDPEEGDGVIQVLERQLGAVMSENQEALTKALDPLAEGGAVSRFLKSLKTELQGADEDRAKQLDSALAALDANDEDSLINRLVRESAEARESLLRAVNTDLPDSPLGVVKATLERQLEAQHRSQTEILDAHRERQEKLDRDIRESLARFEARRDEVARSPRGGFTFEAAVGTFVTNAVAGAPCLVEMIGSRTGNRAHCKKGDVVARFTEESAFAGSSIVFEAKRDASYTPSRALAELDEARSNRGASVGVFVMAASHARADFPLFARHGRNVLVVWDDADPATDVRLQAAVMLGTALITRQKRTGSSGDIKALSGIEGRIEHEVARLADIQGSNDIIRRQTDKIADQARKGTDKLQLLLRRAKDVLLALNIELADEAAEKDSPIALCKESLDNASAGLEAQSVASAVGEDYPVADPAWSDADTDLCA